MALRKVETIVAFIFVSLLSLFLPVKNSLNYYGKFIAVPLLLVSEYLFSAQIIFSQDSADRYVHIIESVRFRCKELFYC